MNRLRLEFQLWLAALGPWTLAPALACAGAALLWAVAIPRIHAEARQQRDVVERLRRQPHRALPIDPAAPSPDAMALFRATLAKGDDPLRFMRRLWEEAARAGLQVAKVDYRHEADAPGGFTRMEVTVPVTGPYPAVRDFAFGMLADFPGLALDKLEIKRDQPSQAEVTATLHFILLERSSR
jgi:hypothetical protein